MSPRLEISILLTQTVWISLQPQRCLVYVKKAYATKYIAFFKACFENLWLEHKDISVPSNLRSALLKVFDEYQTEEILRAAETPQVKEALMNNTIHAFKELGAFGCPWFWVYDGKGHAEPFFGSDRFHFMWDYLGLPHQDLKLIQPSPAKL